MMRWLAWWGITIFRSSTLIFSRLQTRLRLAIIERTASVPLARGMKLGETVGEPVRYEAPGFFLSFLPESMGTRLEVKATSKAGWLHADILVVRPPGHETLNVVVPFGSPRRFQFTSKQNTLPAVGTIKVKGRTYALGPDNDAFGTLDFGRGRWPWRWRRRV